MKHNLRKTTLFLAAVMAAASLTTAYAASYGPGGGPSYYDDDEHVSFDDYDFGMDDDEEYWDDGDRNTDADLRAKYAEAYIHDVWWDYSGGECYVCWTADYQSQTTFTVTILHGSSEISSKRYRGKDEADVTAIISDNHQIGRYYARVEGEWPDGSTMDVMSEDLYVDNDMLSSMRGEINRNRDFYLDDFEEDDFDTFSEDWDDGPGSRSSSSNGPSSSRSSSTSSRSTSTSSNTSRSTTSSRNNSFNVFAEGGPGSGATGPAAQGAGWHSVNGVWKYVGADGQYAMNRWEFIEGKWYYFDDSASMMANAWNLSDGRWYYLGADGAMSCDQWILDRVNPHIWYYVGPDGVMVTNTVINGWVINAAGECYY